MYKYEGVLVKKEPFTQVTEKFRKIQFVTRHTSNDGKDKFGVFHAINQDVDTIEAIAEGEALQLTFYVDGFKWNDKHLLSLSARNVVRLSTTKKEESNVFATESDKLDDLPF